MDSLLSNTLSQETIHQKTRLSRNTDTDSSPVCFEEGFFFQRVEEAVRRREALCCKEQAVRCSRRRAFLEDWSGRLALVRNVVRSLSSRVLDASGHVNSHSVACAFGASRPRQTRSPAGQVPWARGSWRSSLRRHPLGLSRNL